MEMLTSAVSPHCKTHTHKMQGDYFRYKSELKQHAQFKLNWHIQTELINVITQTQTKISPHFTFGDCFTLNTMSSDR